MFFHCKSLHSGYKKPTRGVNTVGELADPYAVGFDLYAPEAGSIDPLSRRLIPLGFAAAFLEGWQGNLRDRSGMGNKGIHVFGGTIEPSYRGEWKVILYNSTGAVFSYERGDRLVQVVFSEVWLGEAEDVGRLNDTMRGTGGLGSTGR